MNRTTTSGVRSRPAHRAPVSTGTWPSSEEACSDLAGEMRRRWHAGECPPAEHFFERDPQLLARPEAAVELIYEEFCLRDAACDATAADELLRRFPQWAGPLRVMFDCHERVLQSHRERPRFPVAGERVGDFRLTAEIARGARGRVFLASQAALADRPVVLKLTPLDGGEHLSLARLQHTNIVPLYSVLDDPACNLRVLCMPYFGRATLASLLEALATVEPAHRTGSDVIAALDALRDDDSLMPAAAGAARQMLASVSYVQAMCWITACLADALHFAHERGLLHLDLKPSNVLLATDGQPMLLDFHLSREPIVPGGSTPENIGGTPPYMPAEQQAAMRAIQAGEPVACGVDARADVFALGAMLYESLGGRLPITVESPPLSRLNPNVTPGLSDAVARCVANRPEDRYADALAFADDLRRHLTDQPLAGVPNRSVGERWRKWRRRRPHAWAMAVATVAVALVIVGGSLFARDRHREATAALADGHALLRDPRKVDQAVQTLGGALGRLDGLPFEAALRARLRDALATGRRQQLALQLGRVADEVRVLYGSDALGPQRTAALAGQCGALWQKRDAMLAALGTSPQLSADLLDIAIFAAHVSDKPAASLLLAEAEAAFGPRAVLDHERRRHGIAAPPGALPPPRPATAWEHYALGRSLLAADDLARAERELAAAVRLAPADRWSNFYYGLCAYRTNRPADAVAAFSVCIGASPGVAGCYYNRALAYAALGRLDEAAQDYDRAIRLDPRHAAAMLNRGMTRFQQGRSDDAIMDLNLALHHGADPATVHYDLALIHHARKDSPVALAHLDTALQSNPLHERASQLRGTIRAELSAAYRGR